MQMTPMNDQARAHAIMELQQQLRVAFARADDRAVLDAVERQLKLWEAATTEFVETAIDDVDQLHVAMVCVREAVSLRPALCERADALQERTNTLRARYGAPGVTH